jgi:hypothetical protein
VIQTPTPTPQTICKPTLLCFDVYAFDTVMAKLTYTILSGPGTIDPGSNVVCFTPPHGGLFTWQIVVTDSCGKADTGSVNWQINFIPKPSPVEFPPAGDTVVCFGDTIGSICKTLTYANPQQSTTITVVPSDAGIVWSFTYGSGSGQLCLAPRADVTKRYDFTFYRVNECFDTTTSVYSYNVTYDRCDSACMVIAIEQTGCFTIGSMAGVDIILDEGKVPIGGFDFLIGYDVTGFTFVSAVLGSAIQNWEYFTYRLGPFGNCGSSCPSGMVRLVAIADMNNGAAHPPASQLRPDGVIAVMNFRVTQNISFEGLTFPISFYWTDCGDNGISSITGDTLLIDQSIYNPEALLWDENDDINFPESQRPEGVGAVDTCMIGNKKFPIRCIEYHNGSICIIDSDSIDARGDINLNGLANEISDAVLFTNYFLRGISVFTLSVAAQTAASDVNNDGRVLTVGDLVYMLRIITGDAQPIPKLAPFAEQIDFTLKEDGGRVILSADSPIPVGGIFLQVRADGEAPAEIIRTLSLAEMEVRTSVDGDKTNIVIYSNKKGAVIPAGSGELLAISGRCEVVHLEASDYYGNMLKARLDKLNVPSWFVLGQNFPNPFNPTTTIDFSLPTPTDWSLSIINVSGQVVRRYAGVAGVGPASVTWDASDQNGQAVATGVYFYRLEAGDFSETRKMVLMK